MRPHAPPCAPACRSSLSEGTNAFDAVASGPSFPIMENRRIKQRLQIKYTHFTDFVKKLQQTYVFKFMQEMLCFREKTDFIKFNLMISRRFKSSCVCVRERELNFNLSSTFFFKKGWTHLKNLTSGAWDSALRQNARTSPIKNQIIKKNFSNIKKIRFLKNSRIFQTKMTFLFIFVNFISIALKNYSLMFRSSAWNSGKIRTSKIFPV